MQILTILLSNKIVLSCLLAVTVAQLIKTALVWRKSGVFHWRYLFLASHMPSSHTATVTALSLALFLKEGLSIPFIIALVLSLIVVRDVIGDKAFAQEQENTINKIFQKITQGQFEALKWDTLIGHSLKEVLAGFVIGVVVTLLVFTVNS